MITVAGIWRYPVKSMGGECLQSVAVGAEGLAGDREWAFETDAAPPGMLRVSGRERRELLRFRASGVGDAVRVRTPSGVEFGIEHAGLRQALGFEEARLVRSAVPQTDCRPLALVSLATIASLSAEAGRELDPRQFRANFYLDGLPAWGEDALAGRQLQLGDCLLQVTERDPRCRIFSLHPETTEPMPELMKLLDRRHEGRCGVYARVIVPGTVHLGSAISVRP